MFHEEEIIDGVLCYRTTPRGQWEQYSKFELSQMLDKARTRITLLEMAAERDHECVGAMPF